MYEIYGIVDGKRVPSKELEEQIQAAVKNGERELKIIADGQHGIGGRLWPTPEGKKIIVEGTSGQRLGSMGMMGTEIVVKGSCSDDVGWLNCGARITVLGDVANGAHNAGAQGVLYVQGSGGARCDTMTKFNPRFAPLQSWYFRDVGDSFAEFKAGGIAVVCGVDPRHPDNILGYRPCVGMVGGTIYFRGPVSGHSEKDSRIVELGDEDWNWLCENMRPYLEAIERTAYYEELTADRTAWKKIVALTPEERNDMAGGRLPMSRFRVETWDAEVGKGGIVGELLPVEGRTIIPFIAYGEERRFYPQWDNDQKLAPCAYNCPTDIPTQTRTRLIREGRLEEMLELVLKYSPLPATVCGKVCPNPCMDACSRAVFLREPVEIGWLGSLSQSVPAPEKAAPRKEKVAVIGGGPAGLAAAWKLALEGVTVSLYEREPELGGKIYQCIPEERLPRDILKAELDRFRSTGVEIHTGVEVDAEKFSQLQAENDAVILASGAHAPRMIPFPGYEDVIPGITFLKALNNRQPISMENKKVVIIGAGNVGMDIAVEAYNLGAQSVIAVDIQAPASFGKEQQMAAARGTRILYPKFTDRYVKKEGRIYFKDGSSLEADAVLISIGESPELGYLPDDVARERGYLTIDDWGRTNVEKLYAVGDVTAPGLITHALGAGRRAAEALLADIAGLAAPDYSAPMVDYERIKAEYYDRDRQKAPEDGDSEALRCLSCGTCRDCATCEEACFRRAISRIETADGGFEYVVDESQCIGCGFCEAVCPCGIWTMYPAPE
jgi:NADPH-dependent glutamate synthase beta subunit-like oxidoreductase/glutamate synthase domain-containing protein 3/NAD-dependent dihydropyrimidine dehydrogenase PreA subunit